VIKVSVFEVCLKETQFPSLQYYD